MDEFYPDMYPSMIIAGALAGGTLRYLEDLTLRQIYDVDKTLKELEEIRENLLDSGRLDHGYLKDDIEEKNEMAGRILQQIKTKKATLITIRQQSQVISRQLDNEDYTYEYSDLRDEIQSSNKKKYDDDEVFRIHLAKHFIETSDPIIDRVEEIQRVYTWKEILGIIRHRAQTLTYSDYPNGAPPGSDWFNSCSNDDLLVALELIQLGNVPLQYVALAAYHDGCIPIIHRLDYVILDEIENCDDEACKKTQRDFVSSLKGIELEDEKLDDFILSRSKMYRSISDILRWKDSSLSAQYLNFMDEYSDGNGSVFDDIEEFAQLWKLYTISQSGYNDKKTYANACTKAQLSALRIIGALRQQGTIQEKEEIKKFEDTFLSMYALQEECQNINVLYAQELGDLINRYIAFVKGDEIGPHEWHDLES